MSNTIRRKKQWIVGLSADTVKYEPCLVNVAEYKKITGLKKVKGYSSFMRCMAECQTKNEKEVKSHE